jgi:hypothetical protein
MTRHLLTRVRTRAIARPAAPVALAVVAVVLAWALTPGLFTGYDPVTGVPADRLRPPDGVHWFGTDHLGRDLFARTVHGTSLSVRAALLAIGVALVAGSGIGLVAGFLGGPVDDALMRATDVLLAIPGLLLSLAVVTALGFGTVKVAVAVGIASVATFARVMRSPVLRVRHATSVEAGRLRPGRRRPAARAAERGRPGAGARRRRARRGDPRRLGPELPGVRGHAADARMGLAGGGGPRLPGGRLVVFDAAGPGHSALRARDRRARANARARGKD